MTYPPVFIFGIIALIGAAVEWMIEAWSDRASADLAHNAEVARRVLKGERSPVRDAVVLNAGIALALTVPDRGTGHQEFLEGVRAGMDRAEAALDSGASERLLKSWSEATNRDDL